MALTTPLAKRAKAYDLTTHQVHLLGLSDLTPEQTKRRGLEKRPSILIPYYDITGDACELFRVRYTDHDEPKYGQPARRAPRLYLPPLTDWAAIAMQPEADRTALVVVEGEWKAIYLTSLGVPTVGLGGVWNWRSGKTGLSMLPDWDQLDVAGRDLYIAFDSDIRRNVDVIAARDALSLALTQRSARVHWVDVPDLDATRKSTGIDDWLQAQPDATAALESLIAGAQSYAGITALQDLNRRYVHFQSGAGRGVWDEQTQCLLSYTLFDRELAHRRVLQGRTQVRLAVAWLDWAGRSQASGFVFRPDLPAGLTSDGLYNRARPHPAPVKGDVSPFLELVDHLLQNEPKSKDWFLGWCAHPFRAPTERVYQAVFLYSTQEGAGKGQLARCLAAAHGASNTVDVSFESLASQFASAQIAFKTFVAVDEGVSGFEAREVSGRIKKLITDDLITVNQKYVPTYTVENRAAFLLTSNFLNSIQMGDASRRYYVIEGPRGGASRAANQLPLPLVTRLNKWLSTPEAGAHLVHFLKGYKSKSFSNKAVAQDTNALGAISEIMRSPADVFARACVEEGVWGERALPEVAVVDALLKIFQAKGGGLTRVGLGIALHAAGARYLLPFTGNAKKRMLLLPGGQQCAPLVLRNHARWMRASNAEVVSHILTTQELRATDPLSEMVAARDALRRAKERLAAATERAKSAEVQGKKGG